MANLVQGTTCTDIDKLPDELLLRIVSLLPFKDAVRTSVLSTRWKCLFVFMSTLNFNFEVDRIENLVGFPNVVDKLFRLRNRCLVDKLCLSRPVSAYFQPSQIYEWVGHGIRELDLSVPFTVTLPPSLFASKTLEVLKLVALANSDKGFKSSSSRFIVPDTVSLPRLKVLHLFELYFSDNDSPSRIVSNCPVLEEFTCQLWENDCKLSVCSSTLKHLDIRFLCSEGWSGRFDIVVNVPNIKYFIYTCWGVTSQTIVLGPTLEQAAYHFHQYFGDSSNYIPNATALLRSISSVRALVLRESTLKYLLEYSIPLPVFGHVTKLVVLDCKHGLRSLPTLLARCESLEDLKLEEVSDWGPWNQLEESRVGCLISRLKHITFSRFIPRADRFEAVKYFLKTGRALKSLAFTLPCGVERGDVIPGLKGRLKFKASKECRIYFYREAQLCLTSYI